MVREESYPLPFPVFECVLDEEELALIEGAVLGTARRNLGDLTPVLTASENGPWVWGIADEAVKRLALLPPDGTTNAASYLLEYEEGDLSPQARSGGAVRAERVEFWRETLDDLRPFCAAAVQRGESVFLYHSL
jgi:hypothetical protein